MIKKWQTYKAIKTIVGHTREDDHTAASATTAKIGTTHMLLLHGGVT